MWLSLTCFYASFYVIPNKAITALFTRCAGRGTLYNVQGTVQKICRISFCFVCCNHTSVLWVHWITFQDKDELQGEVSLMLKEGRPDQSTCSPSPEMLSSRQTLYVKCLQRFYLLTSYEIITALFWSGCIPGQKAPTAAGWLFGLIHWKKKVLPN